MTYRRDLDELRRRLEHVRSHPPLKGWNETKEMAADRHSQNIARIEDEIRQKTNEAASQFFEHQHKENKRLWILAIAAAVIVPIAIAYWSRHDNSRQPNANTQQSKNTKSHFPSSTPTLSPTASPLSTPAISLTQTPESEEQSTPTP